VKLEMHTEKITGFTE